MAWLTDAVLLLALSLGTALGGFIGLRVFGRASTRLHAILETVLYLLFSVLLLHSVALPGDAFEALVGLYVSTGFLAALGSQALVTLAGSWQRLAARKEPSLENEGSARAVLGVLLENGASKEQVKSALGQAGFSGNVVAAVLSGTPKSRPRPWAARLASLEEENVELRRLLHWTQGSI